MAFGRCWSTEPERSARVAPRANSVAILLLHRRLATAIRICVDSAWTPYVLCGARVRLCVVERVVDDDDADDRQDDPEHTEPNADSGHHLVRGLLGPKPADVAQADAKSDHRQCERDKGCDRYEAEDGSEDAEDKAACAKTITLRPLDIHGLDCVLLRRICHSAHLVSFVQVVFLTAPISIQINGDTSSEAMWVSAI